MRNIENPAFPYFSGSISANARPDEMRVHFMAPPTVMITLDPARVFENCVRCGRALKDPKAKAAGHGRICLKKIAQEQRREDLDPAELRKQSERPVV